jgi:hypothetical protein
MNRYVVFRLVLVLVSIGVLIGVGALAFNAGVTQGIVLGTQAADGASTPAPYPLYPMPYGAPWLGMGGLFCFGAVLFLLFIVLVLGVARASSWRGRSGHGWHHGPWGTPADAQKWAAEKPIPPIFTEWHRRSHAAEGDEPAKV